MPLPFVCSAGSPSGRTPPQRRTHRCRTRSALSSTPSLLTPAISWDWPAPLSPGQLAAPVGRRRPAAPPCTTAGRGSRTAPRRRHGPVTTRFPTGRLSLYGHTTHTRTRAGSWHTTHSATRVATNQAHCSAAHTATWPSTPLAVCAPLASAAYRSAHRGSAARAAWPSFPSHGRSTTPRRLRYVPVREQWTMN